MRGGWFDFNGRQKGYTQFIPTRESVEKNKGKQIVYITTADCCVHRGTFIAQYGTLQKMRRNTLFLDDGDREIDTKRLVDCGIQKDAGPTT